MRPRTPAREPFDMEALLGSLEMAGLAVVSVSLWTLRVALTARGRKVAGALTSGLEAIVFILAFSQAAADLAAIERLIGYATGVAIGTLVGVVLDERLSSGQSEVRVVTEGRDLSHVRALHEEGLPVTWVPGTGPEGDVTVAFVAVNDNRLQAVVNSLRKSVPDAFWTVEHLKSARVGRMHPRWEHVGRQTSRLPFKHARRASPKSL